MIITKTPLRITLGGGGTDLPSYYNENDGYVISLTINKYIYVFLNRTFINFFQLKYSNYEKVKNIHSIKHDLIREQLKYFNIKEKIEISTIADVPSGTGLGSSGAFGVGLFYALSNFSKRNYSTYKIAKISSDIEINVLKNNVGHQDNFIAAYGGLLEQKYKKDLITIKNIKISKSFRDTIQNNLVMFYTGQVRNSHKILSEQVNKSKNNDKKIIENLNETKFLALETYKIIKNNNFNEYYKILLEHWKIKKSRSKNISNSKINNMYEFGIKNGALGGKIVGAGGGGFLIFFTNDKKKLIKKFKEKNIKEFNFNIACNGTRLI
jgi:D-glycero-alpha-D-manno-heptose-7-phosphate kinase